IFCSGFPSNGSQGSEPGGGWIFCACAKPDRQIRPNRNSKPATLRVHQRACSALSDRIGVFPPRLTDSRTCCWSEADPGRCCPGTGVAAQPDVGGGCGKFAGIAVTVIVPCSPGCSLQQ